MKKGGIGGMEMEMKERMAGDLIMKKRMKMDMCMILSI